jgi:8-oxo-dGTP diphosphatase
VSSSDQADGSPEQAVLAQYRPGDFARPAVTVDLVIFTIIDAELRVLLVRRDVDPFKGAWALPGGFVRVEEGTHEQGEDLEAAARRLLAEETSLDPSRVHIEQFATFGKAKRDPRTRVISVVHFALVRPDLSPFVKGRGDAPEVRWVAVETLGSLTLAFDHEDMIDAALERIRTTLEHSAIAFDLVPLTFTIPELRHVYSVALGKPMDPGNFRRKFNRLLEEGVIEKAPGKRITASKPATVFRFTARVTA